MADAGPTKDSSPNFQTLVIAIIVGSLGLGFLAWNLLRMERQSAEWRALLKEGEPFARAWLADLREGRIDRAYLATTKGYRSRNDHAAFDRLVADHPGLKSPSKMLNSTVVGGSTGVKIGLRGLEVTGSRSTFEYRASLAPDDSKSAAVRLTVVREAGAMSVEEFVIEPASAPKP